MALLEQKEALVQRLLAAKAKSGESARCMQCDHHSAACVRDAADPGWLVDSGCFDASYIVSAAYANQAGTLATRT